MDKAALDEFFAQADDVLTDWRGGVDAMRARVPPDDVAVLPELAESYYEQDGGYVAAVEVYLAMQQATGAMVTAQRGMADAVGRFAKALNQALRDVQRGAAPYAPRGKALHLHQHRNTGPANPRRLDGRRMA